MFSAHRIIRPAVARAAVRVESSLLSNNQKQAARSFMSSVRINNDQTKLIINAVGTDRLGIVHDMTKEVIDAGGNVGASQAAKLGKYFSLMMLVEVPEAKVQSLTENLKQMQDLSATVSSAADAVPDTDITTRHTIGYKGELSLKGADNPGIVNKVTKILSANGLSIDHMETSDEIAPRGGTVLFRMKGIAHAYEPLADGFDVSKIKKELSHLGDDMNCDIKMKDI